MEYVLVKLLCAHNPINATPVQHAIHRQAPAFSLTRQRIQSVTIAMHAQEVLFVRVDNVLVQIRSNVLHLINAILLVFAIQAML